MAKRRGTGIIRVMRHPPNPTDVSIPRLALL
jgi:hypothetical protein